MSFIKDFFARKRQKEDKVREWEENSQIERVLGDRQKSHGERELLKILEKEKQEAIKEALYWEEQRRQLDERKKAREMMRFNPAMWNDNSILKQKNQFLRGDWNEF